MISSGIDRASRQRRRGLAARGRPEADGAAASVMASHAGARRRAGAPVGRQQRGQRRRAERQRQRVQRAVEGGADQAPTAVATSIMAQPSSAAAVPALSGNGVTAPDCAGGKDRRATWPRNTSARSAPAVMHAREARVPEQHAARTACERPRRSTRVCCRPRCATGGGTGSCRPCSPRPRARSVADHRRRSGPCTRDQHQRRAREEREEPAVGRRRRERVGAERRARARARKCAARAGRRARCGLLCTLVSGSTRPTKNRIAAASAARGSNTARQPKASPDRRRGPGRVSGASDRRSRRRRSGARSRMAGRGRARGRAR